MKIVMLCDAYFDGLQYQENLLAKYYNKYDHSVTILASNFKNIFDYYAGNYVKDNNITDEFLDGIRVIRLPFQYNILNKLRKLRGVKNYLEQIKPDLIYIHDIHMNILDAVSYKKRNRNCKIIMDYHADYSNSVRNILSLYILHKTLRNFFLQAAREYIDKIYYVVPASRIFLKEVYGISDNEMSLLPLGVDMDLSDSIKVRKVGAKKRMNLNIPSHGKVIFSGGKISRLKHTHLIIEALNKLDNEDYYLVLVGTFDKNENSYEEYIRRLAAENKNIHLIGWVSGEEVYEYMDACDIAIFPASQTVLWQQSLSMSLPLVLGEEYIDNRGRSFVQDVDYLNLRDNIFIIRKGNLSVNSIVKGINHYFEGVKLEEYKQNAYLVAQEMLDYNKIVQETISFSN